MPTTIYGSTGVSQVQAGSITAADLDGAQTGSAPIYGCRAWVNFDGTKDTTGATSTANTNRLINASGNVTSVLRNSTGNYTVTFTTAMPDVNYATQLSLDSGNRHNVSSPTTSNVTVVSYNTAGSVADVTGIYVTIIR